MSFKPSQMTAEIGFPIRASHLRLTDPLPLRRPIIERVREALKDFGIENEHAVQAIMEIIESQT